MAITESVTQASMEAWACGYPHMCPGVNRLLVVHVTSNATIRDVAYDGQALSPGRTDVWVEGDETVMWYLKNPSPTGLIKVQMLAKSFIRIQAASLSSARLFDPSHLVGSKTRPVAKLASLGTSAEREIQADDWDAALLAEMQIYADALALRIP